MAEQAKLNRTTQNNSPYVAFQDNDDDDLDEDVPGTHALRQVPGAGAHGRASRRPHVVPGLSARNKYRYQNVPVNDSVDDDDTDEAPASLLVEMPRNAYEGRSSAGTRPSQWNFAFGSGSRRSKQHPHMRPGMNIRERTMWKWANVDNLDLFLEQVC
jgi:hypothetical protein